MVTWGLVTVEENNNTYGDLFVESLETSNRFDAVSITMVTSIVKLSLGTNELLPRGH